MFVQEIAILLLSLFIVISNAVRCTVNCNYKFSKSKPFYIPDSCNEMISAGRCEVDIDVSHDTEEVSVTFSSDRSDYIMNSRVFMMIQFDYESLSLNNHYECKKTDDCAREYARNHAEQILARPIVDYRSILTESKPLLLSNDVTDLICFDTNENIRQCALGTNPGYCKLDEYLTQQKKTTRTCEGEAAIPTKYVSIYDSGDFSTMTIHGNRSLCNGVLTAQTIKNILFKYNVTINPNGRLKNTAKTLSFSSLLILISVFYVKIIVYK